MEFWERDPETGERHRRRVSTGHRDTEKAKRHADRLAGKFAEAPPAHVPLKDLADLGGWSTPRTILEVYQGTDLDAMRQAQQSRRTVDRGAAAGE